MQCSPQNLHLGCLKDLAKLFVHISIFTVIQPVMCGETRMPRANSWETGPSRPHIYLSFIQIQFFYWMSVTIGCPSSDGCNYLTGDQLRDNEWISVKTCGSDANIPGPVHCLNIRDFHTRTVTWKVNLTKYEMEFKCWKKFGVKWPGKKQLSSTAFDDR